MNPYYDMYNPYNGFNEYSCRFKEPVSMYNEELLTLNQAIESIRKSVGDEKEDEIFYDNLIKQAPTEKEKEIIRSIRDDERRHNQILRDLYYNFTGQIIPQSSQPASSEPNFSYKEQLEKALFGELNAVVRYRRIMGTMPSGSSYTLVMSIMTDEIRHASKYNFLIQNQK